MSAANVVSHPRFDRPAVEQKPVRGRRPLHVVSLDRYRATAAEDRAQSEERALRAWAAINGLNAHASIDTLRYRKREADAIEQVKRSDDAPRWAEIQQLEKAVFRLSSEVYNARERILERHAVQGHTHKEARDA